MMIFLRVAMMAICCGFASLGCAGTSSAETDGGEYAVSESSRTRTVCVAPDAEEMMPIVLRAIDAWNDRSTAPICAECRDWDRCLCKAIAHELGHAIGIERHLRSGMMHAKAIRSTTQGLTRADFRAIPWWGKSLLMVDYGPECTTAIRWGYPKARVYEHESAWYERKTKDIWIDPAKRWVY